MKRSASVQVVKFPLLPNKDKNNCHMYKELFTIFIHELNVTSYGLASGPHTSHFSWRFCLNHISPNLIFV